MNWELYRRADDTLKLVDIFNDENFDPRDWVDPDREKAIKYIRRIESLQLIRSRQEAATIIATAELIAGYL